MGKVADRKQSMVELLSEKGKLTVGDVAAYYGISMPTARKMCSALEAEGLAIRTHGGIRCEPSGRQKYSFDLLTFENINEKKRIGRYAASLLESNKTVFFEAGTTVMQCVISFAERIKSNELRNMVVFTNSLRNLEIIHPVCCVNLIGGEYRDDRKDFVGYISESVLTSLHFDYCFIGADGVNLEHGAMAMDMETARFDRELLNYSEKAILLADSGKFGKRSLLSIASVDEYSSIITDDALGDEVYNQYRDRYIDLVRV